MNYICNCRFSILVLSVVSVRLGGLRPDTGQEETPDLTLNLYCDILTNSMTMIPLLSNHYLIGQKVAIPAFLITSHYLSNGGGTSTINGQLSIRNREFYLLFQIYKLTKKTCSFIIFSPLVGVVTNKKYVVGHKTNNGDLK